jgi:hypothetical protein
MVRGARYCLQRDISIGIGLFQAVCVCTLSDLRSFGLRSRRRPLWVFFSRSAASATRQYVRPRMLVVLPVGIEPTTSPLPRGCSTTELRQHPSRRVRPSARRKVIPEVPAADKACARPAVWDAGSGISSARSRSSFLCPRTRAFLHRFQDLTASGRSRFLCRMAKPPRITPKKSIDRTAREARLAKALRENLVRRKEQKRAQDRPELAPSPGTGPEREPPA